MKPAMEKSTRCALVASGMLLTLLTACEQSFRPDLERTGYVSMVFEIDAEVEEGDPNLAEQMIALLKNRVDPKDECGLQWRVVASDRIEVRVPLPPAEIRELRRAYEKAREILAAESFDLEEVQAALALGPEREAKLRSLAGGSAQREALLRTLASAYDECERARAAAGAAGAPSGAKVPASAPETLPGQKELALALRDAEERLIDALDAVQDANFDIRRFERTLEMVPGSPRRESSIADWQHRFPALRESIADAAAKYDAWSARSTSPRDPAVLKRLLRGAGVLEFRLLAEPSPGNPSKYDHFREQLHERGPQPAPEDSLQWFPIDNPLSFLNLRSAAELANFDSKTAMFVVVEECDDIWYVLAKRGGEDGLLRPGDGRPQWRVERAYLTRDAGGGGAVGFELDERGGALFGKLTAGNIRKQLCVFGDDVAYSSARIESRIERYGIITGDFSTEKVSYLVQTLQAGALPASLKFPPISERVVEPKP